MYIITSTLRLQSVRTVVQGHSLTARNMIVNNVTTLDSSEMMILAIAYVILMLARPEKGVAVILDIISAVLARDVSGVPTAAPLDRSLKLGPSTVVTVF